MSSFKAPDESSGDLFLVYGHQGTLDSEYFAEFSRFIVRTVCRTFQILFQYSATTLAKSDRLRGQHDILMYEWAAKQGKLMLFAGHTHRETRGTQTLLERKLVEVRTLQLANEYSSTPDYETKLTKLTKEFNALQAKDEFSHDTLKSRCCYFNDGCCSFRDGSITAYELQDVVIRLVRWNRKTTNA